MFAIPFELVVAEAAVRHPRGVSQAYTDIAQVLAGYGFRGVQGSLHVTDAEDLVKLFGAIEALKRLDWFPETVRDIRAFRVEQWSDFTRFVKS